ncbi:MAG TPA: DUF1080 domain-containing protein [Bryobacteraceae bacterium]|nr:DUF1080 domain-containing protein [Bryobacteraceae bacterium]
MRLALIACAFTAALFAEDGFQPLFNGSNLDQWIVDTPGLWRVENGTIIGKSPGLKYNDFLRTRKHYRNFILKATFRMIDPSGKGNSGIQFRSKPMPESHEVIGYQADIGQQYWGCLYDESRRKTVLAQASAEAIAALRKDDWNEYVITARRNRITLHLNGVKSVEWVEQEPGIEESGFLALQLHSGGPLEMWFKNLLIKELK